MDEIPLQPQATLYLFDKWCMYFTRPIDPPSGQKKHIIVCVDYLTKWVETKVAKAKTEQQVVEDSRENVFYKFRYPRGGSH